MFTIFVSKNQQTKGQNIFKPTFVHLIIAEFSRNERINILSRKKPLESYN